MVYGGAHRQNVVTVKLHGLEVSRRRFKKQERQIEGFGPPDDSSSESRLAYLLIFKPDDLPHLHRIDVVDNVGRSEKKKSGVSVWVAPLNYEAGAVTVPGLKQGNRLLSVLVFANSRAVTGID